MRQSLKHIFRILGFTIVLLAVTAVASHLGDVSVAPTVAFSFLIVVLLSAFFTDLAVSITTSVVATLCFNYFFLLPTGTFNISAFQDWISLTAFLLTAVVISRLTSSARENWRKAGHLGQALSQMKEFGEWLLSLPQDRVSLSSIAARTVQTFGFQYCSLHVYLDGKWHHFTGSAGSDLSRQIQSRIKLPEDHPTHLMELVEEHALGVRYTTINRDAAPFSLLVVKGEALPGDALNVLGCMIGVRLMEIPAGARIRI